MQYFTHIQPVCLDILVAKFSRTLQSLIAKQFFIPGDEQVTTSQNETHPNELQSQHVDFKIYASGLLKAVHVLSSLRSCNLIFSNATEV